MKSQRPKNFFCQKAVLSEFLPFPKVFRLATKLQVQFQMWSTVPWEQMLCWLGVKFHKAAQTSVQGKVQFKQTHHHFTIPNCLFLSGSQFVVFLNFAALGFCLSRGAISSHEWLKVTCAWKWHWVSSKNHWIVFVNQWRWTISFSSFLHSQCSQENHAKMKKRLIVHFC